MINERGGINGRKINLIIADDAFSPSKTVEQHRKLVESDKGVRDLRASDGQRQQYRRPEISQSAELPQFLVQSGLPRWNNPKEFPWSISGYPNYDREARTYQRFILETMPKARIAVLFQNDEFGRTYLSGLKRNLKSKGEANVVAAEAFDITEPTVNWRAGRCQFGVQ